MYFLSFCDNNMPNTLFNVVIEVDGYGRIWEKHPWQCW